MMWLCYKDQERQKRWWRLGEVFGELKGKVRGHDMGFYVQRMSVRMQSDCNNPLLL